MSDFTDIKATERRITETVAALQALVGSYANARQIVDYDADRRKQLLARWARNAIAGDKGMSAAMADTLARAHPSYDESLTALANDLTNAYEVVAKWQALMARLDAARSLMAVSRTVLDRMPE